MIKDIAQRENTPAAGEGNGQPSRPAGLRTAGDEQRLYFARFGFRALSSFYVPVFGLTDEVAFDNGLKLWITG